MNCTRTSMASVPALVVACMALMFAAAPTQAEEQTVKIVSHNLGSSHDSDLNNDGTVNIFDLSLMLSHFRPPPGAPTTC